MKISISFTVDVDAEQWANVYGIDRSEVREDVKNWAYAQVLGQPDGLVNPANSNPPGTTSN